MAFLSTKQLPPRAPASAPSHRMQQVLGKAPLSNFQDLRVERAVHLLKTSDKSLEQIASLVGYAEGVTLRTLLRQRLGRGVRDLRRVE